MAYRTGCLRNREQSGNQTKPRLVEQIIKTGKINECLVEASTEDKKKIKSWISKKLRNIQLTNIKTVNNSFLEALYMLKKEEYKSRYGKVNELILFHTTAASNVLSITKDNYDWRRVVRGKFGFGTSFSNDAFHANRYANREIGSERAFIITKVLVARQTVGSDGLKLPPKKFDTTVGSKSPSNGSKTVYVKYCDNEFLPLHVAYYKNNGLPQDEDEDVSDFVFCNKRFPK